METKAKNRLRISQIIANKKFRNNKAGKHMPKNGNKKNLVG
jgi:hypothetical protein